MASGKRHTELVTGRRQASRLVAVSRLGSVALSDLLLDLTEQRGWQLLGLAEYDNQIPTNVSPAGALVTTEPTSALVLDARSRGIPVVRIGSLPKPEDADVPAVMPEREAVGVMAAEHFAERSFRNVAFIAHPRWRYNRPIFRGLKRRARELGCAVYLKRMHGERPESARDSPEQWGYQGRNFVQSIEQMPTPIGVLASSDITAVRYCRWAIEAGYVVPEQVAVLGVGNERFRCEAAPVPVSSIALDRKRMAVLAVEMLDRLMRGQTVEQTTVQVPPIGVVTRPSTDVLATSDPRVRQAVRFMWDHLDSNLTVDQVAEHVHVSRRTLERAFEQDLGRGVGAEFQRRRLDRAREMLEQTDLGVSEIAASLGFTSANYFGQAFRRTFGHSPGSHRARCKRA